ncbi:MAG: hypothetical protein AAF546_05280, partial [Verrucomicrobiota bacterium]
MSTTWQHVQAVELTDSDNFRTGFEIGDGYSSGYLQTDTIWNIGGSSYPLIGPFGFSESQGLDLDANASISIDFTSQIFSSVGWIDFYLKPAFGSSEELPVDFALGQAAITGFVQVGLDGAVYALHGDGFGNGIWLDTGYRTSLSGPLASDWLRITFRLDYSRLKWDLFLNNQLQIIDVGFLDANTQPLSSFGVSGSDYGTTSFDQFEAGFFNPLFADADNDGIADSYESSQGLDTTTDDRDGDADFDSLANIFEYMSGFEAGNPDSDGDGVHDGLEWSNGGNPLLPENYALQTIPYYEGFELALGTIDGQLNWSVSGNGSADIIPDTLYAWNHLLAVSAGEAGDSVGLLLGNAFDGSEGDGIWVDFWMIPIPFGANAQVDLSEVTPKASSVFFLKEGNVVRALDGDGSGGGVWIDFDYPAWSQAWTRVTIYKDYQSQTYDLWLNRVRVAHGLGFAYPQPYFDGLFFSHQSEEAAYFDNLYVSFNRAIELDSDN